MNILVPHSWLSDYIKTNASVSDISKALSLHSFSCEKTTKVGDDFVYEIEITPNRGDALSILGIARELNALLPRLGFKCEWIYKEKEIQDLELELEKDIKDKNNSSKDTLDVEISDSTLVPRFSAIILDNIKVKTSPTLLKERLEKVGIRPINNVVDITNYMMIDKGQPMHAFDYDKIKGHKMKVRLSRNKEELTTLDGVKRILPEGVIVIEDGDARLIDLCGIMGAENSQVDENTTKVLLFVQVYDSLLIRKASMSLGHRTEAALRFEKGIDFLGVIPSLWEAVSMMKKHADCTVSSDLIDIINTVYTQKEVNIDYERINSISGVNIDKEMINDILTNLGFEIKYSIQGNIDLGEEKGIVMVPSWRVDDIDIPEDLAEEVIRIYGYYNIPNILPSGQIPLDFNDNSFDIEKKIREYLSYQGFFECYTYSSTSEKNVDVTKALKLKNPLNEDIKYLRTSLIPQLLEILNKNKGYSENIKVFEISSIYKKVDGDLPTQNTTLGIACKGLNYLQFKGIIQGLYDVLYVNSKNRIFEISEKNGIFSFELDLNPIFDSYQDNRSYVPLVGFNSIKEEITVLINNKVTYDQIENVIKSSDDRVYKVVFKDLYEDSLSLGIEFLDRSSQINSENTSEIREKILKDLEDIKVYLKK